MLRGEQGWIYHKSRVINQQVYSIANQLLCTTARGMHFRWWRRGCSLVVGLRRPGPKVHWPLTRLRLKRWRGWCAVFLLNVAPVDVNRGQTGRLQWSGTEKKVGRAARRYLDLFLNIRLRLSSQSLYSSMLLLLLYEQSELPFWADVILHVRKQYQTPELCRGTQCLSGIFALALGFAIKIKHRQI